MQRTLPVIKLPKAPADLKQLVVWAQKLTQQLEGHFYNVVTTMNTGAQGAGPDLASAPVITPSSYLHQVTGTQTISTINNPNGASSAVILKSIDGFSLGPGGNIDIPAPTKIIPPAYTQLVYHAQIGKWHVLSGQTALNLSPLTFATLPANPAAGTICYITDCNSNAWGGIAAGGGTDPVLVWFNGVAWTVLGK